MKIDNFILSLNINSFRQRDAHFSTLEDLCPGCKSLAEIKFIIDKVTTMLLKPKIVKNVFLRFYDEPTLHNEILEILDYMLDKGVKYETWLKTNGMGIIYRKEGKKILKKFNEVGIKGVRIFLCKEEGGACLIIWKERFVRRFA